MDVIPPSLPPCLGVITLGRASDVESDIGERSHLVPAFHVVSFGVRQSSHVHWVQSINV